MAPLPTTTSVAIAVAVVVLALVFAVSIIWFVVRDFRNCSSDDEESGAGAGKLNDLEPVKPAASPPISGRSTPAITITEWIDEEEGEEGEQQHQRFRREEAKPGAAASAMSASQMEYGSAQSPYPDFARLEREQKQ